jgi:hypothetical protein
MQMEQIEKATGKKIIRIETNDLDQMEEVTCLPSIYVSFSDASHILLTDDEEGLEIIVTRRVFCTVDLPSTPITDLVTKMLGMDRFRVDGFIHSTRTRQADGGALSDCADLKALEIWR